MEKLATDLPGVFIFKPRVFEDHRGFFQESWNKKMWQSLGMQDDFVQDNHSYSKDRHTIRGFHFQTAPMEQAKLVRVLRGRILDVAVDIRPDSPHYLKSVAVELSAANHLQLYIPRGFAHGFCTLVDDCDVCYKVDQFYSPVNNAGVLWNDPEIKFNWPTASPVLSDQDKNWPTLAQLLKKGGR